jgi:hypothetical protein
VDCAGDWRPKSTAGSPGAERRAGGGVGAGTNAVGSDEGAVTTAGAVGGASEGVPALADVSVDFSGSGDRGGLCFIEKTASV